MSRPLTDCTILGKFQSRINRDEIKDFVEQQSRELDLGPIKVYCDYGAALVIIGTVHPKLVQRLMKRYSVRSSSLPRIDMELFYECWAWKGPLASTLRFLEYYIIENPGMDVVLTLSYTSDAFPPQKDDQSQQEMCIDALKVLCGLHSFTDDSLLHIIVSDENINAIAEALEDGVITFEGGIPQVHLYPNQSKASRERAALKVRIRTSPSNAVQLLGAFQATQFRPRISVHSPNSPELRYDGDKKAFTDKPVEFQ
ncbi:hypothetical protein GMRT_11973 [Giardia muris]|uniref:Uncharacterized protein n=1 Tax=Giardia muris TaxID=5742 RepID=A0A4Z1SU22_GIAMU|nr:hypothetical protein GMRT_11973 [Giardia muris]|eukprot:TNJ29230.1 hypothetical protein GMRT_11973 [Giardia muris]